MIYTHQSNTENDSFLPSATQRYHQLLLPALQVLVALVATLGSKHITAINQVCTQLMCVYRLNSAPN